MSKVNNVSRAEQTPLRWLWPILLLAPLSLAPKCNSAEVGDDCPDNAKCMGTAGSPGTAGSSGTAGSPGTAGSSSMPGGGVGKTCGGLQGLACADGLFCQFDVDAMCGAADQTGTCQAMPDVCADIYAPVCGCDDKTYGNECEAHGAGISVARNGECQHDPGDVCGGIQGLTCDSGEYCHFPAACGSGDQTGTCIAMPNGCTREYMPVCGCDGVTYGNACMAASAGVSVASAGECETTPGEVCGGLQGLGCEQGEYCSFPPSAQCGAGDQTGTCAPMPEACDLIYAPVCGCDDMTYGNACAAAAAGVSVASQGECGGQTCGGFIGTQCEEANQFCDYPPEMQCGFSDGSGVCRDIPEVCAGDVNPVCGCDGNTYSNACQANAKGVSVATQGACE